MSALSPKQSRSFLHRSTEKPAMQNFSVFNHAALRGAMHFVPRDELRRQDFIDGTAFVEGTPVLVCESGSRVYDVMTTSFGLLVVSPAFVAALSKHGITGWKSLPSSIFAKRFATELHGYTLFLVTGSAGEVRWELARRVERPPIVRGGLAFSVNLGLVLEEASWDGSDIFWPRSTAITCMTERAVESLKAANVTNVKFTLSSAYESSPR